MRISNTYAASSLVIAEQALCRTPLDPRQQKRERDRCLPLLTPPDKTLPFSAAWLIQVVIGWRLSQRQPTFKKDEESNAAYGGNEHFEHLKLPRVN